MYLLRDDQELRFLKSIDSTGLKITDILTEAIILETVDEARKLNEYINEARIY